MSVDLGVETIGAFCRETEHPRSGARLRDLCPAIRNPEEAASGTTSAALVRYLHREGLLGDPAAREAVVEQGFEMERPSRIRVRLLGTVGRINRVEVSGNAIRRLRGEISQD
jgi:predicted PhzF superfamily epimerase YddE/YHI9